MKKTAFFVFIFLFSLNLTSQDVNKIKFKVLGNCNMCKSKIESTTLSLQGVQKAEWNLSTRILLIKFDKDIVPIEKIQKKIANIGYDNEGYRASDSAYTQLHYCCQYDRIELK